MISVSTSIETSELVRRKMKLELLKLSRNSKDRKYLEQVNDEAFPVSERMSFDEIFDFASNTNTDVLGIYDNGNPVGFAVVLKNEECGYVYYVAIDSHMRSKGYGGATMKKMMEAYPQLQLVLDFEAIDENAENHEQRTRQFKKVLKNERPFGFSALCGMNLFGYIELRFSLPPDGDWLGALKPPF